MRPRTVNRGWNGPLDRLHIHSTTSRNTTLRNTVFVPPRDNNGVLIGSTARHLAVAASMRATAAPRQNQQALIAN